MLQNEPFESKLFHGQILKLPNGRLTVESFDVFVRGYPIFTIFKMTSNLKENWIVGGLLIITPTRLIHFNGNVFV